MSTTSELIDAYTKAFDSDYFKNMQGIQAGLEAMYKSITGNDAYKQIQASEASEATERCHQR